MVCPTICTGVLYNCLADGDGVTALELCDWSVRRSVPVFCIIVLQMETGGQFLSSVIGLFYEPEYETAPYTVLSQERENVSFFLQYFIFVRDHSAGTSYRTN